MEQDQIVPEESNPLQEDLQLFEKLAECSPDSNVRDSAAALASLIKHLQASQPLLSKAAKELGIDAMCQKLSSEEIAHFIAIPDRNGESKLRRMLGENLVDPLVRGEKVPGGKRESFLTFCCLVFHNALTREYLTRRSKKENRYGRAIRQLLVEEALRGKLVVKLGNELTCGLFFPDEARWESEDSASEAILKIWERVSEFTKVTPMAADPKALLASMEGGLNTIPGQARDHVRTLIETGIRRAKHLVKDNPMGSPSCETEGQQTVLVEMIPGKSRPEDDENKILVEQLLSATNLEPRDKELIKLYFYERHTQEETAALLGLSQAQVSKQLRVIRASLKNSALRSHPEIES